MASLGRVLNRGGTRYNSHDEEVTLVACGEQVVKYRSRAGEGAPVGARTAEMEACLAAACGEEKDEDLVGGWASRKR